MSTQPYDRADSPAVAGPPQVWPGNEPADRGSGDESGAAFTNDAPGVGQADAGHGTPYQDGACYPDGAGGYLGAVVAMTGPGAAVDAMAAAVDRFPGSEPVDLPPVPSDGSTHVNPHADNVGSGY